MNHFWFSGSNELDTVECLPKNAKKWQKRCKLPMARSNAGVCTINDKLYCIGGWNGQIGIKQCDVYHSADDQWSSMAPLLVGRYQSGIVAYNDKLWVAGGSDAWNCLGSVEMYDPETDNWTMAPSLLTPRRGCGLASFNGKLYAVGGSDGTHSLSSTEIYDEESKTWIVGPNLTTARANVSCVTVGNKLYAIGGFAGKCFLNTLEYLDANTNEWTTFVPQSSQLDVIADDLVHLHLSDDATLVTNKSNGTNGTHLPNGSTVNGVHGEKNGDNCDDSVFNVEADSSSNRTVCDEMNKVQEKLATILEHKENPATNGCHNGSTSNGL